MGAWPMSQNALPTIVAAIANRPGIDQALSKPNDYQHSEVNISSLDRAVCLSAAAIAAESTTI
jgi:hypothetical protein